MTAFENELGVQAPVGFWDPAGLSSDGSVENFKRRRQTELKHGRISMLATMGYITPEITGKFPGYLSPSAGLKFADVPNGLAAISKVPAAGWGQILAYMAFCEVSQDQSAGTPAAAGDFGWKLITSTDPEVKKTKLNAELANGRLAMMAIIGMFFQVMGEWWWAMFKGWRVKGDGWWVNGETSSDIGPWVIWKTDLVLVFDKGWCFWLMFGQTFSVFVSYCFLSCEAWSMLVSA